LPSRNLHVKIRVNHSYAIISKLIHESVTKDTMYKVPSRWNHLWREFNRRYKHNVYRAAANDKVDLFFSVGYIGKLRELEALAAELFKPAELTVKEDRT
jgi:5'-deoxynucleotidase YfbR-like HD superfamily hydrolase